MAVMNSKKAFEVEFHWVFVLIAGAVILVFFLTVAQKQKTISQDKLALSLSSQLESTFIGALQSQGTAQLLQLPSDGITFYAPKTKKQSCGAAPACDCAYYVFGRPTKFEDKIMFVPDELKSSEAIVWTLSWKMPFGVANFLYLTTKAVKYVIVAPGSDSEIQQLKNRVLKDLPEEIEKQVLDDSSRLSQKQTYGYEKTRIIFLGENPSLSDIEIASKGRDVSVVVLKPSSHEAIFFNKKPESDEFDAPVTQIIVADFSNNEGETYAALYAAIFAETPHLYECQMKEAYKKLGYATKIIISRAEMLQEVMHTQNPHCALYTAFTEQGGILVRMFEDAQKASQNPNTATSLLQYPQDLQKKYVELMIGTCPGIY